MATLPAASRLLVSRHDVLILHSVDTDDSTSSKVSMTDQMNLKTSPNNLFSVYNRAFVFNVHGRDMDLIFWLRCMPHIPAVLLYNAGLAFHRLALRDGCTATFRKALDLYEMSKIVLENNVVNGYYMTELDVVLLALANNMGHCHSHFNNMLEARICLERLLTIFFISDSSFLLTRDEYVFFYMNILLGESRSPILAAAA